MRRRLTKHLRGGRKRESENISQAKVDVMPSHNINLCLARRGCLYGVTRAKICWQRLALKGKVMQLGALVSPGTRFVASER
jgi:hypothetical protein